MLGGILFYCFEHMVLELDEGLFPNETEQPYLIKSSLTSNSMVFKSIWHSLKNQSRQAQDQYVEQSLASIIIQDCLIAAAQRIAVMH